MRGRQRGYLLSLGTGSANWNRSNHDLLAALFLLTEGSTPCCSCASTGIFALRHPKQRLHRLERPNGDEVSERFQGSTPRSPTRTAAYGYIPRSGPGQVPPNGSSGPRGTGGNRKDCLDRIVRGNVGARAYIRLRQGKVHHLS